MAKIRRVQKNTEERYLQIYHKRLQGWPILKIANEFGCKVSTVGNALRYCQYFTLDLTKEEDIQLLIDAKNSRIDKLHERIQFLEDGWDWEEFNERVIDGTVVELKKKGTKFSPPAEALMYGEIRHLEDAIAELKGLLVYAKAEVMADFDWESEAVLAGLNPQHIRDAIQKEIESPSENS